MQFISAQPLLEKFRSGTFNDSDAGPYFIGTMVVASLGSIVPVEQSTSWDFAAGLAMMVITIVGVLHLKQQNGNSLGNRFFVKYFTLGWVILIRMLALSIPIGVVTFAIASLIGGDNAEGPAVTLFTIAFGAVDFWWLGLLFKESLQNEKKTAVAST